MELCGYGVVYKKGRLKQTACSYAAGKEMFRHAFEDCGMQKVWIGYYEGNDKSKRVQEKCGFKYQWRSENVDVPLMHEKRTGHVSLMTKEDWEKIQKC